LDSASGAIIRDELEGSPPHYPRKLFAFLVLGAVGLALIAVGITGHTGWALIIPGVLAVIVSLPIVYAVLAPQINAASKRHIRS